MAARRGLDYEVLRDGMPALANISIAHDTTFAVAPSSGQEAQQARGLVVSGNYFDILGVQPARGASSARRRTPHRGSTRRW